MKKKLIYFLFILIYLHLYINKNLVKWKTTKNFFRESDAFGISFTFRFKKENNFATWQGGVLTFLIIAMYLFFGIYYFIPFVRRENYTLFYDLKNNVEQIKLNFSISSFEIKMDCHDENQNSKIKEYLNFSATYITKINNSKTTYEPLDIDIHKNDSILYNKNGKIFYNISGRHGEDLFQYIEISINSRINTSEYISEIDKFLFNNDCKIEFHYPDYAIHYEWFEEPLEKFNNKIFLQLNPYFNAKMNVFFMRQTLTDDHDILFQYKDKKKIRNIFSTSEQYFLYKGNYNKKEENRPENNGTYANIFIRADIREVKIKRKYPTFFEFWADTFSFWNALFAIIAFILNSFYKFYAFYPSSSGAPSRSPASRRHPRGRGW